MHRVNGAWRRATPLSAADAASVSHGICPRCEDVRVLGDARRRVLVVEDDLSLAALFRRALVAAGYDVQIAGDGLSALWRIESARPDLIVLDLRLPRFGGEGILRELHSSPHMRGIPVVVVTGAEPQLAVVEADAILMKPCDPKRLVGVVAELAGRPIGLATSPVS